MIVKILLVAVVGYLLGSIPFGAIVGHRSRVNIQQLGSGKIGATNVLRTMGRKAAAVVAALDVVKGALAVVFAGLIVGHQQAPFGGYTLSIFSAQVVAGLAAMAGHIWPVFLRFRGGRGVATFFGSLIALCPVAGLFGGEVLIIGAGLTGFASLGSITGVLGTSAVLLPLTLMYGFPVEYLIYSTIGSLVIIYMHRDNIKRLLAGQERKISDKVS